jgi:hypothetical protein
VYGLTDIDPFTQILILYFRSIIINHLQETFKAKDTIVLFIYCNYKKQYTVQELVAALLKQLALHNLTSESSDLLKDFKRRKCHPPLSQLRALVQNEVKMCSCVFLVIDALDEYPDRIQKGLVAQIQSLTSLQPLVTSRTILAIEHALFPDCKLHITAKGSDIHTYMEAQFSSPYASMMRRLISKPSSTIKKEDIIEGVTAKAQGMYVFMASPLYNFLNSPE